MLGTVMLNSDWRCASRLCWRWSLYLGGVWPQVPASASPSLSAISGDRLQHTFVLDPNALWRNHSELAYSKDKVCHVLWKDYANLK